MYACVWFYVSMEKIKYKRLTKCIFCQLSDPRRKAGSVLHFNLYFFSYPRTQVFFFFLDSAQLYEYAKRSQARNARARAPKRYSYIILLYFVMHATGSSIEYAEIVTDPAREIYIRVSERPNIIAPPAIPRGLFSLGRIVILIFFFNNNDKKYFNARYVLYTCSRGRREKRAR